MASLTQKQRVILIIFFGLTSLVIFVLIHSVHHNKERTNDHLLHNYVLSSTSWMTASTTPIPIQEWTYVTKNVIQCPAEFMTKAYDFNFTQEAQNPPLNDRTDGNILILIPFSDSVDELRHLFRLLCVLTYPHERISIGIGMEDNSGRSVLSQALTMAHKLTASFNNVTIHLIKENKAFWNSDERHNGLQPDRKSQLALLRNELLSRAIRREHHWVLWLDTVNLAYIPPSLVELLLSPSKPIVSPACVKDRPWNTHDRSIWRETKQSRRYLAEQREIFGDEFLYMEPRPPAESKRTRLVDLRNEGKVVPIDGVGGCALLVEASCHRNGLVFPSFVFESHIYAEGLAKMATKMGYPIYGLPFVQVFYQTNMTEHLLTYENELLQQKHKVVTD